NVASLNVAHGGDAEGGSYHSIYDSYDFFRHWYDTTYAYGKAESNVLAVAEARLLDAPILPWSFSDAARTYTQYASEIDSLARVKLGEHQLDLFLVRQALDTLTGAGTAFDQALDRATAMGSKWLENQRQALDGINHDIYLTERDLGDSNGLPRR